MPIYHVKLKARQTLAQNTVGLLFEKPADFVFKAGQFASFTLTHLSDIDIKDATRSLSLSNPPYANDLMLVTRLRESAFKSHLLKLPIGSEIKINASYGTFTLHPDPTIPAVFLTGGIGIAPVRSMVLQASRDRSTQRIFLFYSNRKPEEAIFLEELTALQNENPYYTFISTMTKMEESQHEWQGETGYIQKHMITKYVDDLTTPIYYIVGPSEMVKAMRKTLTDVGVVDNKICTEEFRGY